MSRKPSAVQIESDSESDAEENVAFDDDTDLPLPDAKDALPNFGTRGALLEEIRPGRPSTASQSAVSAAANQSGAGRATRPAGMLDPRDPLFQQFAAANNAAGGGRAPTLVQPGSVEAQKYEKWTCVYPIYIDAKRAYGTGQRRIARETSVWWPKSQDILVACASFQLHVAHEPQAFHPRDWENPGRVKVLWKENGRPANPNIPTKKRLFEMIAAYIQGAKPEQAPDMASLSLQDKDAEDISPSVLPPSVSKSKAPPKGSKAAPKQPVNRKTRPHLPKPPRPLPPLHERYSLYSPLVPSGSLLEAWKVPVGPPAAGEKGVAGTAAGAVAGGGIGGGKGKRKVIKIKM